MKIIIGLIQRGIEVTNPRITPVYHFLKRNIKRAPLTTYQIRNCKIFADPTFCTFHTAITRRPCVKININYRNYKTLGNFFNEFCSYYPISQASRVHPQRCEIPIIDWISTNVRSDVRNEFNGKLFIINFSSKEWWNDTRSYSYYPAIPMEMLHMASNYSRTSKWLSKYESRIGGNRTLVG